MFSMPVSRIAADGTEKDVSTITTEYEVMKKNYDLTKMEEACTKLVLHVEDSQLSHMCSHDQLKIWQMLEHVQHATGFTTSLVLSALRFSLRD